MSMKFDRKLLPTKLLKLESNWSRLSDVRLRLQPYYSTKLLTRRRATSSRTIRLKLAGDVLLDLLEMLESNPDRLTSGFLWLQVLVPLIEL